MNSAPRFLSLEDVLVIHALAIEDQGGDATLRDRVLLESAVATPAQQFEGHYLHEDIPAMAAAYAFHICQNHPFIDGNKRAGVGAMITFLLDNGWSFDASADEAEPVILQLAAGALKKEAFSDWARKHMREKPKMELREFFSRIEPENFNTRFLSMLPGQTGASVEEFAQRAHEAAQAIPILANLAEQQQNARDTGDQLYWERITFLAVGMMTLYALAEDMGYEW